MALSASRKILIVDDEAGITETLKAGLERHGFEVDSYNDPVAALSRVGGKKYDLAIFDIRMPRMNGFELFREFKKIDGQTKVCFFTAFDMDEGEFAKVFPDIQVEGLFKKPISIALLKGKMEEIIGREDGHPSPSAGETGAA